MALAKDGFADLERYRKQLEESVTKLKSSLRHWQTWEAEYEGMKEEISGLGEEHTASDLGHVGRDFDGELLNDKEIKLLLMDANGGQRPSNQVVGLLSRRIDYVQANIKTIKLQLEGVEQKLTLSEHISRPEVREEGGLPVTDIREELDDEGNIISSSTIPEADTKPHIVEALRKAGVKNLPDTSKRKQMASDIEEIEDKDQKQDVREEQILVEQSENLAPRLVPAEQANGCETTPLSGILAKPTADSTTSSLKRKKSVTFAEGTKTEDSKISRKRQPNPIFAKLRSPPAIATAETVLDVKQKTPPEQLTALLNAEANLMRHATTTDADTQITSPVIPDQESHEDAVLRRQMLQYNMQEVGAVVAEIDLDDDESTPPYSEDEDEDNDDDTSTEEEEDEHGRSTNILLSDEYIEQMKALEKRLNASMIENVGSDAHSKSSALLGRDDIDRNGTDPLNDINPTPKDLPTKGVRFAEKLEIQEAPAQKENKTFVPTVNTVTQEAPVPAKPKMSRFKNARNTKSQLQHGDNQSPESGTRQSLQPVAANIVERPTPTGPPDRPHVDIIERPFTSNSQTLPQEPDDFDPALLEQQVATEYHRHRNRMIYRQGGFLGEGEEDEDTEVPVDENEGGKKVSRFMAARLGRK